MKEQSRCKEELAKLSTETNNHLKTDESGIDGNRILKSNNRLMSVLLSYFN